MLLTPGRRGAKLAPDSSHDSVSFPTHCAGTAAGLSGKIAALAACPAHVGLPGMPQATSLLAVASVTGDVTLVSMRSAGSDENGVWRWGLIVMCRAVGYGFFQGLLDQILFLRMLSQ